jgi:preprotein translocase subunit SecG
MEVLEIILTILVAVTSAALILVVLLQSGKEAGLSGALAGGSETYMSKNKKGSLDQVLARSTKWIALVWILLTLSLSLI